MKYLRARNRDLSLLFAPVFGNLSLLFAPAWASQKTFRSYLPRPFRLQTTFRESFALICPGLLPRFGIFRSYLPRRGWSWNPGKRRLSLLFAPTLVRAWDICLLPLIISSTNSSDG